MFFSVAVSDNSLEVGDANANVTLRSNYESPHKFSIGQHFVNVEAVDSQGNRETCTFHVIVEGK